jgi:hypothetical protein
MEDQSAGRSALSEYQRLRSGERRRGRRRALVTSATTVAVAAVAGGGLLLIGAGLNQLLSRTLGAGLPGPFEREAAVATALAGSVWVLTRALRPPQETEAWRAGALGEQQTALALTSLTDEGWCVLHDRRLPASPANVDHIVVGPAGVWVIETKAWHGRVVVGADRLRRNGQVADAVFDQLWRQSNAITAAAAAVLGPAGIIARPVLCLPRANLVRGRDASGRLVSGPVEVYQPDALVRRLRLAPPILTPTQVDAVVALIDRALPPARPDRPDRPDLPDRPDRPDHPRRPDDAEGGQPPAVERRRP